MRASEIRDLPTSDILNRLDSSRREMFNLRIAFHTNTLEDPNQIRLLRKDMARMLTILRERDLATAYINAVETATVMSGVKARRATRNAAPSLPEVPVIDGLPTTEAETANQTENETVNAVEEDAAHGE